MVRRSISTEQEFFLFNLYYFLKFFLSQTIKIQTSTLRRMCAGQNNSIFMKKKFQNDIVYNEILGFKVLEILDSNGWHLL